MGALLTLWMHQNVNKFILSCDAVLKKLWQLQRSWAWGEAVISSFVGPNWLLPTRRSKWPFLIRKSVGPLSARNWPLSAGQAFHSAFASFLLILALQFWKLLALVPPHSRKQHEYHQHNTKIEIDGDRIRLRRRMFTKPIGQTIREWTNRKTKNCTKRNRSSKTSICISDAILSTSKCSDVKGFDQTDLTAAFRWFLFQRTGY